MGAGGPRRGRSGCEAAGGQYAGLAEVWAADATLAYGPMARHLVARAPFDAAGCRAALDAGAGSGVAGDALRARGARVVAADREFDMASYGARPAVTADVTALPFRSGASTWWSRRSWSTTCRTRRPG